MEQTLTFFGIPVGMLPIIAIVILLLEPLFLAGVQLIEEKNLKKMKGEGYASEEESFDLKIRYEKIKIWFLLALAVVVFYTNVIQVESQVNSDTRYDNKLLTLSNQIKRLDKRIWDLEREVPAKPNS